MFQSLRGDTRKRQLVEEYELIPIIHSRFITGEAEHGLCGQLEGVFYEFSYKHKIDAADCGTFRVGHDCGEQILAEMGHPPVPLIDPLIALAGGGGAGGGGVGGAPVGACDPLVQEVQQVISLLVACTRCHPTGLLAETAAQLRLRPKDTPQAFRVLALNAYVRARMASRGMCLSPYVATLPRGRAVTFPLIADALAAGRRVNDARLLGDPKRKHDDYFDDWVN